MDGLTELESPEFAAAAIERLAELIEDQPALFQASRRGSERDAESLSARPFQGIVESIQNGDDLGATELRVALRVKGSRRELLIASGALTRSRGRDLVFVDDPAEEVSSADGHRRRVCAR